MNLVYLDGAKEPYTTSEIISECAQVKHDTVQALIRSHHKDLGTFGVNGFEIRKPPKGTLGGRPVKVYRLNEQQATLLITYLKNTEPVRQFKLNLVRAFYDMRDELNEFKVQRALEKPERKELTQAIKEWPHANHHSYKHFTDLLLKLVTRMNAKQLKSTRGASGRPALDLLKSKELARYRRLEGILIGLIELGHPYDAIKAIMKGVTPCQP